MALLRRKTNRRIVAVESDDHGGHKLGLCNPATVLPNGEEGPYSPGLTHIQPYLWELRQSHIDNVIALARGDPVTLLLTGDLTHGFRHQEHLMSTRRADQVFIGFWNVLPWLEALFAVGGLSAGLGQLIHGRAKLRD